MRRLIFGLVLAALVAGGPACAQFLPKGFGTDGAQTHGSRFGVTIGMSRNDARKALESHWNIRFSGTWPCREGRFDYPSCYGAQEIDDFDVSGDILGGSIDLYIRDEKVVAIAWWHHPLDF